jgi:hypothetical protein
MLRTIIRAGSCAVGLLLILGGSGCQPQNGSTTTSTTSLGTAGADRIASANQGRFPAPTYSQDAQPAYALTGDQATQDQWSSLAHDYQVGNGRISLPVAP